MKEAMFEGPEVLEKILQDADEANRDPDEVDEKISAEDAKEDADELSNIMNELKGGTDEKVKESDSTNEDANNNVCSEPTIVDVALEKSQPLTFEETYNSISTDTVKEEANVTEDMDMSDNNMVLSKTSSPMR